MSGSETLGVASWIVSPGFRSRSLGATPIAQGIEIEARVGLVTKPFDACVVRVLTDGDAHENVLKDRP
jgi:hypothetical protein